MNTNMSDLLVIIFMLKKIKLIFSSPIAIGIVVCRLCEAWSYFRVYLSLSYLLISWKCLDSMTEFWIRYIHGKEMSPFGSVCSPQNPTLSTCNNIKLPASHVIVVRFWKSKKSTLFTVIEWTVHLFVCVFVCSISLPLWCVQ